MQHVLDLLRAWWGLGLERETDTLGMTIQDGHAVAMRAHLDSVGREGGLLPARVLDGAKHLHGLALNLFFLARNVRHDVIMDVKRGYARVASATERLQCRDDDLVERAKSVHERFEGRNDACSAAVGVCHNEALGQLQCSALCGDHVEVRLVGERHDKRAQRVHAVIFGVAEYANICRAQRRLCVAKKKKDMPPLLVSRLPGRR